MSLDVIIFFSLIIIEALVLVPVKFKVDKSALFILFLYLIVSLFRIINDITDKDLAIMLSIVAMCQGLIWATLYHFVFEMRLIQFKLSIQEAKEFYRRAKNLKILKIIIFTTYLVEASLISILLGL